MDTHEKYQKLQHILQSYGKAAIAFSGGVDSTFLLKAACETLEPQNVLACIGVSASLSQYQLKLAREMAALAGAELAELPLDEMNDPNYQANKADRCFHCKTHQFRTIKEYAAGRGFARILCGSNFDDRSDYRPGHRAVEALEIATPLMDVELSKAEIRTLSRRMGLPTADMPASPCLASRVAYGESITEDKLRQVEAAEELLRSMGFVQFRVRHHGTLARIEVPQTEIAKTLSEDVRATLVASLKSLGFVYVTLDLEGFRSGAMNDMLSPEEKSR
ncbi:MAG: ATP-dependent sacrificial sulfur transferase LarE [Planctomycetaceae bacterium]|nr:ATP-dependent sacrificial sulfur transferase LarE [Planctomycetaceae bacterium]